MCAMGMKDMKMQPDRKNDPGLVKQVLELAGTYLSHGDRLIYSYGSKTFLSGYDLYDQDYDGRGNIDCSTFILLVLAGIPYERSPYATGSVKGLTLRPFVDMDLSCFEQIPERYMGIAERIGHPELAGPKGIDLEKMAALNITIEQLMSDIKGSGMTRRSVELAMHHLKRGECFLDESSLQPGDLVFYQSKKFFSEANHKPSSDLEVTHVGIISEDPAMMINSSGYFNKERAEAEHLPAVSLEAVRGKRTPVFYARPSYRRT